ncbi:tyrosine-type recombinase/integrase [Escherichia coli]|uniref:site-specific integrase n=1 Tax=Escherichia coli TaxID=562 RepID=UPI0011DC79DE|nr:site-specific integrase [Escherichia coli]EAR9475550.1 site-specific integrase [Salmonella enterica]EFB7446734.1 site-specific integrase [Escherichia coli]EFB8787912.1 site-specific integrase [Escherichia coli]EJQ7660549.1 site-specific integrase [Escherichia coli]EKN5779292.1 site-specific integrase [Escherichia coli]
MARIIHSSSITFGTTADTRHGQLHYSAGTACPDGLPALYDSTGHFVEPVNQWFLELKTVKRLVDINTAAKAMLRYWRFLERENLEWNHFPPVNRLKPTYRFRSEDLLSAAREGRMAFSTANSCIGQVVRFYIWAIENHHLVISSENAAPFKLEFVARQNNGMLAHLRPRVLIQTSDLRIRVPRHANPAVSSLTPLSMEHLSLMAAHLNNQSHEFILMSLLACESGLRLREACSFTVNALQEARPASELKSRYHITIGPRNGVETKFGKTRTIEVSATLLNLLRHYALSERRGKRLSRWEKQFQPVSTNPQDASLSGSDSRDNYPRFEPVFISQQGNPVRPEVLNARWGTFRNMLRQKDSGFRYRFHDLRSTYATYRLHSLFESGLSEGEALDCLMGWMGHQNESTTFKYIRYLKMNETLKFAFSVLDTVMSRISEADHDGHL